MKSWGADGCPSVDLLWWAKGCPSVVPTSESPKSVLSYVAKGILQL